MNELINEFELSKVPTHLSHLNSPFLPLKPDSKSREPSPVYKFPDYPQAPIYNTLWVKNGF